MLGAAISSKIPARSLNPLRRATQTLRMQIQPRRKTLRAYSTPCTLTQTPIMTRTDLRKTWAAPIASYGLSLVRSHRGVPGRKFFEYTAKMQSLLYFKDSDKKGIDNILDACILGPTNGLNVRTQDELLHHLGFGGRIRPLLERYLGMMELKKRTRRRARKNVDI